MTGWQKRGLAAALVSLLPVICSRTCLTAGSMFGPPQRWAQTATPTVCGCRANWHFHDFVFNWVHHMTVHGISNYIVGAMDAETGQVRVWPYHHCPALPAPSVCRPTLPSRPACPAAVCAMQALAERGLNVFAMYDETAGQEDTGLGTADFGWGSPTFHKMGRQKVRCGRAAAGGVLHSLVSFLARTLAAAPGPVLGLSAAHSPSWSALPPCLPYPHRWIWPALLPATALTYACATWTQCGSTVGGWVGGPWTPCLCGSKVGGVLAGRGCPALTLGVFRNCCNVQAEPSM